MGKDLIRANSNITHNIRNHNNNKHLSAAISMQPCMHTKITNSVRHSHNKSSLRTTHFRDKSTYLVSNPFQHLWLWRLSWRPLDELPPQHRRP